VAALLVLLQALVIALTPWIGALWASVLVGVVVAAVGYALVRTGLKMLNPESLSPDRSARQLKKTAQIMKGS
jgi:xanthine/uracil permease